MNFPDETGKMSEGQKGDGTAETQKSPAREGSQNYICLHDIFRLRLTDRSKAKATDHSQILRKPGKRSAQDDENGIFGNMSVIPPLLLAWLMKDLKAYLCNRKS